MSNAANPSPALVAFRKCVLLEIELSAARVAMHEILRGAADKISKEECLFLNAEIEMFAEANDLGAITQDHVCWLFDHYPIPVPQKGNDLRHYLDCACDACSIKRGESLD